MNKLFKCSHCGIEFESTNYRKYCSKKCSFSDGGWTIDEKTNCWNWSGYKDNVDMVNFLLIQNQTKLIGFHVR